MRIKIKNITQTFFLALGMGFALYTCSGGASPKVKLEGEPTGLLLDFYAYNVPWLDFSENKNGIYGDIGGSKFPIDEHGILATARDAWGAYYAPQNPALFVPHITPNAGLSKIKTYNIGGFTYSAWVRLTDNTKVSAGGGLDGFVKYTFNRNEPQAAILAVPFVDAEKRPLGSLMVAVFQNDTFPTVAEVPLATPSLCNGTAGLCKNVVLMMNFHEGERKRAYVIGTARVPSIVAQPNSMSFNPNAGPAPENREQLLKANGFHKVSLQVGDDVPDHDLGGGSFHGPTLRVLIDGQEVIVYKNSGGSHQLTKGWWDAIHDPGGLATGEYNLSISVFNTATNSNGNPAPYPGFFWDTPRSAPYSNGAKEYNQAWKNLVGDNSTGNMANMATFGVVFQLGATGEKKISPAGSGTVVKNTVVTNSTLSPQVAGMRVMPYHEGKDTSNVSGITIEQTGPIGILGNGTAKLSATIALADLTKTDINKDISWATSDSAKAWVEPTTGIVHGGKNGGMATITATHTQTGKTATIQVDATKVSVTSVSLNKSALTLDVGKSEQLSVASVSPDNVSNRGVTWSSNSAGVATVVNGKVTGVATGTATIKATAADGSGIESICTLTVVP